MTSQQSIGLAAAVHAFSEADLAEAAIVMSAAHPVEVRPLQRGGTGGDVEILIQCAYVTWQALGPNLAASAIWDGLRLLWSKFRSVKGQGQSGPLVTFKVDEKPDGGRTTEAFVRVDDPEMLREAMKGISEAVRATFEPSVKEIAYIAYDEETGDWNSVDD